MLIDTNILVYRYDNHFPNKQQIAEHFIRDGIASGHLRITHQSIVEFIASTTRGAPGNRILEFTDAIREAEELMALLPIIYPDESVLRMALRGAAAYSLSWSDAHIWAYAEVHGIRELFSENFQHGRMYGTVTAQNPFLLYA
ncbi:MAG: PIN domain-containing protein [Candidatus Dadabacteria bacterium]|nr:PIN domain-containing protein [Candidatus Dadabacteria bacterium]MDE0663618.1 PIN domain-containing protein [Candidatus Dadabacteria bacterium]